MPASFDICRQVGVEDAVANPAGCGIIGSIRPPLPRISLGERTISPVDFAEALVVCQPHGFPRSIWVSKKLSREHR